MAFVMQFSFAQEKTITGTVTAASDGLPLPGVNVIVKGTARGTQTDFDGKYSVKANQGDVLIFSYVSMTDQEVPVGASNTIDITMSEDVSELDEVIVTAYGGTTTLKKNASSLVAVKGDDFKERANASALQNLQGNVAGLAVATGNGQPGVDPVILLRGVGSINSSTNPLFIVDGIPVSGGISDINPQDIESYTVLKDAAAANIYGTRAANGAIIITTKKAQFNESLSFTYSTSYGYSELQDQPFELMNTGEILRWQRTNGDGLGNGLTDAEINAIAAQTNTSWTDVFFRRGVTTSHDLAISSGSEKTTNRTSLQYFEQDGIFIGSDYKRFSLRNNFTGRSANEKFDYNLNIGLTFSKTNEVADNAGSGSTFFNPFSAALQGLPYLSIYNPDGSQTIDGGIAPGDATAILASGATNFPYVLLNSLALNTDLEEDLRILVGFNANYNFAKNLTAGIRLGADLFTRRRLEILHPESILGPFQSAQGVNAQFGGIQEETYNRDFRFNSVTKLNYSNVFANKHSLDVSVFLEYIRGFSNSIDYDQFGIDPRLIGTGSGFISGNTTEVIGGATTNPYIPNVNSTTFRAGTLSVFGTLDYEYDGKYGFAATVRRDNSFRFVNDNKWGTFWSVAGRWNISEEKFMEDSAFDLLKLRASYGESGNDLIDGAFYLTNPIVREVFTSGLGYNGTNATVPTGRANVAAKWETTKLTNIGIDFGVWNSRLSGSLEVYEKITDDLYQSNQISLINGQRSLLSNIGTISNKGFEVNLRYDIIRDKDWYVSVNANGSFNKNEVEELPPSTNGLVFAGGSQALGTGEASNEFYLVRYAGVNPSNGNPLFYTRDGNLTEQLTDDDRVFTDKFSIPSWNGGFGFNVSYKDFDLSTQWSFAADVYRNNLDFASLQEVSQGSVEDGRNRSVTLFNGWQNPGDITDIPRVGSQLNSVDYINQTDRYLEDASFLRLRNITFGYTLPEKALEKLPITGLRLYVQGENLLTFTKYRGWDPEAGFRGTDRGQFPTPKIYTFGATINF